MKKQMVLILSRVFPIFHRKKGMPTRFRERLLAKEKIHTIRTHYERWKHNLGKCADGVFALSIREWEGKPYNSRQIEICQMEGEIGYQRISMSYDPTDGSVKCVIDGKPFTDLETLAHNDGLSYEDWVSWMFEKNKTEKQFFSGIIIHFTDFRY